MFERKRNNRFGKAFSLLLLIGAISGFGYILAAPFKTDIPKNLSAPQNPVGMQRLSAVEQSKLPVQTTAPKVFEAPISQIAGVAQSSIPSVVGISVLKADGGSVFENNPAEKWGVGTGVIVSQKGYIITNHHVAGGINKRIVVSLSDSRTIDGITVWADPVLDLAVVKINLPKLAAIPMGDSNTVQVGETVVAIGNPLGLQFQSTVTSGIVSALNRTIKIDTDTGPNFMEDLIQTDASINPGNSGGPLLNIKGQVIGINTIKVTTAEGIGFAVPINVVHGIIRQLDDTGEFVDPYIGIFAYDKEVMPYVDINVAVNKGIYVANIDDNGPSAKAGIKVGNIIESIDKNEVNTMAQFRSYIYSKKPGQDVTLGVQIDGKVQDVKVTLSAKNGDGLVTR